jgi:hypothetical protein
MNDVEAPSREREPEIRAHRDRNTHVGSSGKRDRRADRDHIRVETTL